MADTSNLSQFLTDVADAIRTKKETTEPIAASEFDAEILKIETGTDTSDATATANDIIIGKTAYVDGEKLEGTLADYGAGLNTGVESITPDTGYDGSFIKFKSSEQDGPFAFTSDKVSLMMTPQMSQVAEAIGLTSNKLVKGNTVLGIEGTAEAGSGDIPVKLFETEEEMNADTDPKEGDLAVVYKSEIQNVTVDSQFQIAKFPATVVLPQAITDYVDVRYKAVDSSVIFDCWGDLNSNQFIMDCSIEDGSIMIQYESSDGITYTRTDGGEETVDFGTEIYYEMPDYWNDAIGYFIQVGEAVFEGLFEYDGTTYAYAENQLNATSDLLYNSTAYGKNGIIEGTLTQNVSNSFADVNAEVYTKIQQAYDNMEPRILTDDDKEIDENIYFIPIKSDGTPLLDMSQMTDASNVFSRCENIVSIPLLNTSSVTNMYGMFNGCTNLTTIPQLDTTNVTNMYNMFNYCRSLTTIPLLNTSSVTNMYGMFASCTNLTTIPLLNTSSVTNMYNMFSYCRSLTTIPLLDTSSVTKMDHMFSSCSNLTTIPLLNTSSVTSMYCMFQGCTNLTTIPQLDTTNVTNMGSMFGNCTNLTTIPLLNTSSVTNMYHVFNGCTNLTDVPQLDTSSVTGMYYMFNGCSSLSDESLNNILAMCSNATSYTASQTLKSIGLSEEQAERCKSLSNYQAFLDAGWTTGY